MVNAADDRELPWAWREPKFMAARSNGSFLPKRLKKKVYKWENRYKAVVHTKVHDCKLVFLAWMLYCGLGWFK
jgi:hypothetical protein